MSQHILLKYATRKPYKSNPKMPDEAVFDLLKGYWIQNNHYLITSTSKYDVFDIKWKISKYFLFVYHLSMMKFYSKN